MTETTAAVLGPVQLVVIRFDQAELDGGIRDELARLREADVVRLIDALLVRRDDAGTIEVIQQSDLTITEAEEIGAYVGALIGLGIGDVDAIEAGAEIGASAGADGHLLDEEGASYIADSIPNGTAAAIVLLEHRWAIPLRDAIVEAGGSLVGGEWISPVDLLAAGLLAGS